MKPRDVIRMLEADGWAQVRLHDAHHQYKHPTKSGLVTLAIHGGRDVPQRDIRSIEKQSDVVLVRGSG